MARMNRVFLVVALLGIGALAILQPACTPEPKIGGRETIPADKLDKILAVFNRGVALMEQYQPQKAVTAFEQAVRLAPSWGDARLNLGIALLNAQSEQAYQRAEQELTRVATAQPDNPIPHYALGVLLRHLNRSDEAHKHFERVLAIDPDSSDVHYQLAEIVAVTDPAKAQAHLERVLQRVPHHESACYRLQTLLRQTGDTKQADELLGRFNELRSSKSGMTVGFKYGQMGRYAELVRTFGLPSITRDDAKVTWSEHAAEAGLLQACLADRATPPGLAIADIDGDRELDLVITGTARGISCYRNQGGKFQAVTVPEVPGAIGAFFGDFDADGDPDLYVTSDKANRLFRNDRSFKFVDVTEATKTAGAATESFGAQWADADHDGDLDLYVANNGAPNALFRNNGDGTFTDVARETGVDGGDAPTLGVVFLDADGDRDFDIYLLNDGTPNALFLNDRTGRYSPAPTSFDVLADAGSATGAHVLDIDGNGLEDIFLLRGAHEPLAFVQTTRGIFTRQSLTQAGHVPGATNAALGDFDLDGDVDILMLDVGPAAAVRHQWLRNPGFTATPVGEQHATATAGGSVAADLDGDGTLEVLVVRTGSKPELWRTQPPAGRHWLRILPERKAEAGGGIDPTAAGLQVEVKTGRHLQLRRVQTSAGYLSSPPLVAHFGMPTGNADYVRLLWADSVLQSELEIPGDGTWIAHKIARKPSSCPIIFTWNGEKFAFVTDFLGVGGIGFFASPGESAQPDPTEAVRLPPELIKAKNGRYLVRIAEPLEEVSYFDQLRLRAYDHPASVEVHPDERFAGGPPWPTGEPQAIRRRVFPIAARTDTGKDVLATLRHADRDSVAPPKSKRFTGYARDHWVELDFGKQPAPKPGRKTILYLWAWTEYTYSHVNYAAYQAGITMQPAVIEVPDGDTWRVAIPHAGFPAGLPRMMTVNVSELPLTEDGRLRLRTNMEIFWDQAFLAEDVPVPDLKEHVLDPVVADLRLLGYPREYSPDGRDPTIYDYHRIDHGVPFKTMAGAYTRFGDVRPLLRDVDDRFVIMGKGEELALEFDATALPPLPDGWSRTLVLWCDGFCKDMDLYTAMPDTVEPLPHHRMEKYPPLKPPSNAVELKAYRKKWNTRRVTLR